MSNREIKFRVWDRKNNRFLINIETNRPHLIYFDLWDWSAYMSSYLIYPPSDEYVFQQYTGLKDKNGVEIYEGDILKCKSFDGWFDKVGFYYNREVKHVTACTGESEISGYLHVPVDKEVVGNIFENPELLKNVE